MTDPRLVAAIEEAMSTLTCDVCEQPIHSDAHSPHGPDCPDDPDSDQPPIGCQCDFWTHEGCCWECNGPIIR